MGEKVSLYRHFDGDDVLLYVGMSISVARRLVVHESVSVWFDQVRTITIEKFDNLLEAAEAEKQAIASESPKFNSQHSTTKPLDKEGIRLSARGKRLGAKPKWPQPDRAQSERMLDLWHSTMPLSDVVSIVQKMMGADVPAHWVRDKIKKITGSAARSPDHPAKLPVEKWTW